MHGKKSDQIKPRLEQGPLRIVSKDKVAALQRRPAQLFVAHVQGDPLSDILSHLFGEHTISQLLSM